MCFHEFRVRMSLWPLKQESTTKVGSLDLRLFRSESSAKDQSAEMGTFCNQPLQYLHIIAQFFFQKEIHGQIAKAATYTSPLSLQTGWSCL